MTTYAKDTDVSVEKSRAELETILRKYGSDSFGYMSEPKSAIIQFRANGKRVMFTLPMPDPKEKRFRQTPARQIPRTATEAEREWEQACRSSWRALVLCVRAKLEAVQRGITTFEAEFMAHIVLPNGRTVAEEVLPMVELSCTSGTPLLQLNRPE